MKNSTKIEVSAWLIGIVMFFVPFMPVYEAHATCSLDTAYCKELHTVWLFGLNDYPCWRNRLISFAFLVGFRFFSIDLGYPKGNCTARSLIGFCHASAS
jgi:hypothetical protein